MDLPFWFDYQVAQHYLWKDQCQFQRGHRAGPYLISSIGDQLPTANELSRGWSGLMGASYWRYETLIFISSKHNECSGKCCPSGFYAGAETEDPPRELIGCYWQTEHIAELMHHAIARALHNLLLARYLYKRCEGVWMPNPIMVDLVTEVVAREHLNEETDGEFMISPRGCD